MTIHEMMMNFLNAVEENGTSFNERPYEEYLPDFGITDNVLDDAEFFQIFKAVKLYHYAQNFEFYLIDLAYHWNWRWDSVEDIEEHKEMLIGSFIPENRWEDYRRISTQIAEESEKDLLLHWEENQDIIKFCYGMGPLSDERLLLFTFPTSLTEDEPVYPNIYEDQ